MRWNRNSPGGMLTPSQPELGSEDPPARMHRSHFPFADRTRKGGCAPPHRRAEHRWVSGRSISGCFDLGAARSACNPH